MELIHKMGKNNYLEREWQQQQKEAVLLQYQSPGGSIYTVKRPYSECVTPNLTLLPAVKTHRPDVKRKGRDGWVGGWANRKL